MPTVTFSNGKSVTFDKTPTPEDIDYVAKQLGIQPDTGGSQQPQTSTAVPLKPSNVPTLANGDVNQVAANRQSARNLTANLGSIPKQERTQSQKQLLTAGRMTRAGNILGDLFGGNVIGQAIGTKIANKKLEKLRKESLNSPTMKELQSRDLGKYNQIMARTDIKPYKGPTTKQVVGDIGKSALSVAAPGVGGKSVGVFAKGVPLLSRFGRLALGSGTGALVGGTSAAAAGTDIGTGMKQGALIATALPVAGGLVRTAGNITGRVGKGLASAITGKKMQLIDEIINNPKEALIGLRSDPDLLLKSNANTIRKMISDKSRQASDDFGRALKSLPKRLGRPSELQAGQKTKIRLGGKTQQLTTVGVKQKLTTALREFGVEVNPKNMSFDFMESPFDLNESKRLQEAFKLVREWKNTSPEGLHRLSVKLRNFRKSGEQSPELNSIIDRMSKGVHEYLGERVPAAKEMLEKFSQAQDIIDAFDQEFSTKGSFLGGTSENITTQKKLANIFSGEKTGSQTLLKSERPEIIPQEAGRQFATAEAGTNTVGFSISEAFRALSSAAITPKQVGEILVKIGYTKQQIQKFAPVLSKMSPQARIEFIKAMESMK